MQNSKNDLLNIIKENCFIPTLAPKNIFYNIDMVENSHTKLLLWLLNVKKKGTIQYYFLKEFLSNKELNIKNADEIITEIIKEENYKFVTDQHKSCDTSGNENGYIDIFMHSKIAHFVCAIEVKLDAKISTTKQGNQLKRYYDYIKLEKYKPYKYKKIIYLCTYSEKEGQKHINENATIDNVLEQYEYVTIEHSDIVLMLYKVLKEHYKQPKFYKDFSIYFNKFNAKGRYCGNTYEILNVLSESDAVNLLYQYIDNWQYYNKRGTYTAIVRIDNDYVYLYEICKKYISLLTSFEEFTNLDNNIKEIIINHCGFRTKEIKNLIYTSKH